MNPDFIIVRDPGPDSELDDIMFAVTADGLAKYRADIEAESPTAWTDANHEYYCNDEAGRERAAADAAARMMKRARSSDSKLSVAGIYGPLAGLDEDAEIDMYNASIAKIINSIETVRPARLRRAV